MKCVINFKWATNRADDQRIVNFCMVTDIPFLPPHGFEILAAPFAPPAKVVNTYFHCVWNSLVIDAEFASSEEGYIDLLIEQFGKNKMTCKVDGFRKTGLTTPLYGETTPRDQT